MENGLKTSVVIVTHNRAKHLETLLQSLTIQTLSPEEVVVVDNASGDQTKKTALSFQKRLPIRYVFEAKLGIPYARNRGLKEARGDLILFIDDDCKATPDWIKNIVDGHRKHPQDWAVQGRSFGMPKTSAYSVMAEFNRYLSIRGKTSHKSLTIREFLNKNFKKEFATSTCDTRNFSIKKKYLKQYRLSFDKNFYRGSDSDFGRQIINRGGRIIFNPSVIIYHWEREKLSHFLEQRWHIGRTAKRLEQKWPAKKTPALRLFYKKLKLFVAFCIGRHAILHLPFLLVLFFLDRLFHLNGRLYEKNLTLDNANPHIKKVY